MLSCLYDTITAIGGLLLVILMSKHAFRLIFGFIISESIEINKRKDLRKYRYKW
jgi:hypothetical protein